MTDEELRECLLKADALLEQYKRIVEPIAEELAHRKEKALGFKYTGELGCWESGIDEICLHIYGDRPGMGDNSPYEWEMETRNALFGEISHIYLGGHF